MNRKVVTILLALIGLLALSQVAMAEEPVYFADANLKAVVESTLGISNPTPNDMLLLTTLESFNYLIGDLTGIEYAINLTHLDLHNNRISDISSLAGLTKLTLLWLDDNPLNLEAYCTYLPLITNNNPSIYLSPPLLDSYPPGGNGCNDGCECEGNFDGDEDEDGTDATTFKHDFGRSAIYRPCTNTDPCNGDFSCNGNVDGSDAELFKLNFGRSIHKNTCPTNCVKVPWCDYSVTTTTTTTP